MSKNRDPDPSIKYKNRKASERFFLIFLLLINFPFRFLFPLSVHNVLPYFGIRQSFRTAFTVLCVFCGCVFDSRVQLRVCQPGVLDQRSDGEAAPCCLGVSDRGHHLLRNTVHILAHVRHRSLGRQRPRSRASCARSRCDPRRYAKNLRTYHARDCVPRKSGRT